MKFLILPLLMTSFWASASSWRHHECTVNLDDKSFRMDIYSSWDRCEGREIGKRYSALLHSDLSGNFNSIVKGKEWARFNHSFYEFKNFGQQYPGTLSLMLPSVDENEVSYSGYGDYIPSGSGHVVSVTLTCHLGSEQGTDCED